MIKYAIIRVVKPSIETATAQLEVLCRVNNTDVTYWKSTNCNRNNWVLVANLEDALKYSENATPVIPYGVQVYE